MKAKAVKESGPLIGDAPQLERPLHCSEPGQKGGSFTALFDGTGETSSSGGVSHRVDRVLSFFSSRPSWGSPPPHTQACVPPPLLVPGGGGHTRLQEIGLGGPQFVRGDRHLGTLGIRICTL
jgi:hypothetical protein